MILIVDDDITILAALKVLLKHSGYSTLQATSPAQAIEIVRAESPDLVLMDMNYTRSTDGTEGLTLLKQIKIFRPGVPVILMTAWGSIDLAVEGVKAGAFDFITKPWDNRKLLQRIETALELNKPETQENRKDTLDRSGIIGNSPALENILKTVARVATTNAPVLICGESGTGKELIAQAIHRNSQRRNKAFIKVNLGGMPSSLFESEMFGHKKGAFTGAVADRKGRFEMADGGTIFLDEIGELDAVSQVKLLRVLQEQSFEPLGSSATRHVDVRVICATNADLPAMVATREFREDLFYRINLVTINMPSLRQRPSDIPLLAEHFASELRKENAGIEFPEISADAMAKLRSLPYPGNVRELKNLIHRSLLLNSGECIINGTHLVTDITKTDQPRHGSLEALEKEKIEEALRISGGNISQAASALGLSRAALYRRIEKFNIR